MNGVRGVKPLQPRPRFACAHPGCGATFSREWKMAEHQTTHTGARPYQCAIGGCARRFQRSAHLRRHAIQHQGAKRFQCKIGGCGKGFFYADKFKRHVRFAHGDKSYFKCNQASCALSFKKRRLFRLHLQEHNLETKFRCTKEGCDATFDSHIQRKAHEKKHEGYRCPHPNCLVIEQTWGKLQKHKARHQPTFTCSVCKKEFKKAGALWRHKRTHASHKPVLMCPREDCQAYFSTTFNLEHHIRKVHLQLLKHKCSFPDCTRMFAMRESMQRHLLRHDPTATTLKKRLRPKKAWQKRLNGNNQPLVEQDLRRLFALRMRVSRRAKVEANLSGLFNERKIPHYVDPEANLRGLFGIKLPRALEMPQEAPVKG